MAENGWYQNEDAQQSQAKPIEDKPSSPDSGPESQTTELQRAVSAKKRTKKPKQKNPEPFDLSGLVTAEDNMPAVTLVATTALGHLPELPAILCVHWPKDQTNEQEELPVEHIRSYVTKIPRSNSPRHMGHRKYQVNSLSSIIIIVKDSTSGSLRLTIIFKMEHML